jgi:hypothetical protein
MEIRPSDISRPLRLPRERLVIMRRVDRISGRFENGSVAFDKRRKMPMSNRTCFACLAMTVILAATAMAGERAVRQVVADGSGFTKEDAIKDACRAAIRQAVGEVVDAETVVENDRVIKDEILVYSDGLVERHEVTDESREGGIVRVTIKATVARRTLVQKLKAARITINELDDNGEDVVSRVRSDREARDAAAAMVEKAFLGFPGDQLEAKVVEWKPIDDDDEHITLAVRVEIAPSVDAEKAFREHLCQRLEDLAKLKGEFTTTLETHRAESYDPCELPYIGQGNFVSGAARKLMPDLAGAAPDASSNEKLPMVVAVASLVSRDRTRIDWRYFVLDGSTGDAVIAAARRTPSCKLVFQDADGSPVAIDRFDPARDEFHVAAMGRTFPVPWNKYLLKCWIRRKGSRMLEFMEYEQSGGDRDYWDKQYSPAMAFVAPVFFGRLAGEGSDTLFYVPAMTVTRHIRLTEEEVMPIRTVSCELTYRNTD